MSRKLLLLFLGVCLLFLSGCAKSPILATKLEVTEISNGFHCNCGHYWATFTLATGQELFVSIGGHDDGMLDGVVYAFIDKHKIKLSDEHRIQLAQSCHDSLLDILGKLAFARISRDLEVKNGTWNPEEPAETHETASQELISTVYKSPHLFTLLLMEVKLLDLVNYPTSN